MLAEMPRYVHGINYLGIQAATPGVPASGGARTASQAKDALLGGHSRGER